MGTQESKPVEQTEDIQESLKRAKSQLSRETSKPIESTQSQKADSQSSRTFG